MNRVCAIAFALLSCCGIAAEFPNVPICGLTVGERITDAKLPTTRKMLGYDVWAHEQTNEFGLVTEVGGTIAREFEVQTDANALADELAAAVVKKYGIIFGFSVLDDGRHHYVFSKDKSMFSIITRGNCQPYSDGTKKNYYTAEFTVHDYSIGIPTNTIAIGGVDVRKCDYDEAVKMLREKPAAAEALLIASNMMASASFPQADNHVKVGGYEFGEYARAADNPVEACFYISHDDPHKLKGDNISTLGCFPDDIPIREWPFALNDVWVYARVAKGESTPLTGRLFLLRFCEMHPETSFDCDEVLAWALKIQSDIEKDMGETFIRSRVNTNNPEQVSVSFTNATYRCWVNVSLREDMSYIRAYVKVGGKRIDKEKPKRICVEVQISDKRLWEQAQQEATILEEAADKVRVPDVSDEEIISACCAIEAKRMERFRGLPAKTR